MKINDFNPVQTTPYSLKYKLKLYLWKAINRTVFRVVPNQIKGFRIILLKCFGARLADSVNINRKATIDHPWNLTMGNMSSLGVNSWINCVDQILIGEKCCIGKDVYLLTAGHDINSSDFKMTKKPIVIQDGTWVATGSYILPGVTLGRFNVVAAGSVVIKSTQDYSVLGGNPAKHIKNRF